MYYNPLDDVARAILERLPNADSFEPYHSAKERQYKYYRIYVKNYIVYYVVKMMRVLIRLWKSEDFCIINRTKKIRLKRIKKKKKRQFPKIQNVNQTVAF